MAEAPDKVVELARLGMEREDGEGILASGPFPIQQGRITTFVYKGRAERVALRHWIWGLPTSQPFERLAETDYWHLSLELPERSRIEYKLEVTAGGKTRWLRDPLNPREAHDPFGANSVCHGPGYVTPAWTRPDPEARPGRIELHELPSSVFDGVRRLQVYLPPRFRKRRRYPLLIVHDGEDFLRYASLRTVLDNLISRLEVQPVIVALIEFEDRLKEYGADPRHGRHLSSELIPWLEDRYPLRGRPEARGVMGASFGAVASLATAWQNPGVFGRLLLLSGSFAFTDIGESPRGPEFESVVRFMNQFRANPSRITERTFMSCGIYESLIYENRSLVPLIQATGTTLRYTEARDGHNWHNWRDQLREGLSFLFPGPLWMVYE